MNPSSSGGLVDIEIQGSQSNPDKAILETSGALQRPTTAMADGQQYEAGRAIGRFSRNGEMCAGQSMGQVLLRREHTLRSLSTQNFHRSSEEDN